MPGPVLAAGALRPDPQLCPPLFDPGSVPPATGSDQPGPGSAGPLLGPVPPLLPPALRSYCRWLLAEPMERAERNPRGDGGGKGMEE